MLRRLTRPGYFHDAAQPPLRIRAYQVHPRADAEASRMGGKTARGTRDLVGQDAARALRRARDGPGPRGADAVRLLFRVGTNSSGRNAACELVAGRLCRTVDEVARRLRER